MGNVVIPERAADDPKNPIRLRLYWHLQRLGAADGFIDIAPADLADMLGVNRKTVYKHLGELVRARYLECETHSGIAGGRIKRYRAVIDERPSTVYRTTRPA